MFKSGVITILILVCCTSAMSVMAQDVPALLKQAQVFEKAFRDEDALRTYLEIIRLQPRNVTVLSRLSELHSLLGKRFKEKDKQREYYRKGVEYARSALKIDPNNSEANFAMAISMGRMAQISSGEEKIKAVKDIKQYADKCVLLDPTNYKGYHVLGKWHFEVSDLSTLERWLVKVTYGGLPPSSIHDAVKYYEKSMQLAPGFLLNYLELAKAYEKVKDKKKARLMLEQLQRLPPTSSDDPKIKGLGKKMLDDL